MKSLEQIKKELHEYIDSSVDEKGLMVIYENTLKHSKSNLENDNTSENHRPIPNHQQEKLDETIDHGSLIGNKKVEELNESISRWFNDGGKNPD